MRQNAALTPAVRNGTIGTFKRKEKVMDEAVLIGFRRLADALAGDEPRNWQWIGPHMSQRMFGITETRAKNYAERHGGIAREMVQP